MHMIPLSAGHNVRFVPPGRDELDWCYGQVVWLCGEIVRVKTRSGREYDLPVYAVERVPVLTHVGSYY